MKTAEQDQKSKEIQTFRYGVIAELANPYLVQGERISLIKEKASREYQIPYSLRTTIGSECIRKWLSKYRKYGIDGLLPKIREDKGKSRSILQEEIDIILTELEAEPYLTARAVVKRLKQEGKIKSDITSSSLSRLVISSSLRREDRIRGKEKELTRKFNFFYPLECVQADDMHGFPIPDGFGKMKKAILIAFIDDATRRIVYSDFSFTEKSLAFEDGIKHILGSHGRIGRLYVDNGSTFISNQTKRIMNSLGIMITHSRPYIPKGRGKIERFFRTVRDQFLRPLNKESIRGLGDLNARFRTWLETEYHRTPHSGLEKKTPLDTWLSLTPHIIRMDPSIDLDTTFLHEVQRKVYKDCTFTLHGTLFEVPAVLIGKKIRIFYNPNPPIKRVQIYHEGKSFGDATVVDTYANTKIKRNYKSNRDYSSSLETEVNKSEKHTKLSSATASLAASNLI